VEDAVGNAVGDAPIDSRWDDDTFLDELRAQTDVTADETVAALVRDGGVAAVNRIFATLRADDRELPADAPAPLRDFIAATEAPLPDLDFDRLQRGGDVFLRHGFSAAIVLLLDSLPQGYSAPCLSRLLTISDDLGTHPYKRLMGVLQLLVDISQARAFTPGGRATVQAQKMRLLHAGVRLQAHRFRPDYQRRFGLPVNHEDMLATSMGFSWLVISGLRTLGASLRPEEEEDLYYLWYGFSRMMGIHPPGRPDDDHYVPRTVAEAEIFYDAYARRQYAAAEDNPDGVMLSRVNLKMVEDLLPRWTRWLGLGILPRLVMTRLLGEDGMERVGIPAVTGHRFLGGGLGLVLRTCQRLTDDCPGHLAERLGRLAFQEMIDVSRGGEVTFCVPVNLEELHSLA